MLWRRTRRFYHASGGKAHHKEEGDVELPKTCPLKYGRIMFSAPLSYSCLYGLWSGSVSPADERLAQKYPDAALRIESQTWRLSKWKAEKQSKFHALLALRLSAGPEREGVVRSHWLAQQQSLPPPFSIWLACMHHHSAVVTIRATTSIIQPNCPPFTHGQQPGKCSLGCIFRELWSSKVN